MHSEPSPTAAANPTPEASELSFEQAFRALEEAVARLEEPDLSLDEAMRVYETGIRMARRCEELLAAAELKVKKLDSEGQPASDLAVGG